MGAIKPTAVLSHWNNMVEGFSHSSDHFYTATVQKLAEYELKDVHTERVTLSEGGLFAAKREYLQVKRGEFVYHVCAAPHGSSFFVSSWLGEYERGFWAFLASIPYLGRLVGLFRAIAKPLTYYRIDTAQIFHSAVHAAVTKTLDGLLEAKGLRAMTPEERKPVMKNLWDKR